MAQSNTGDIFEIKLQVRYNGLKATQYFSKFTSESDKVFRDDLLALKLPHPKRNNTTFISHGCIECAWPTVSKNGILHKQLATKSQAPQQLLQELSISNITIKYIYPPKANKRPNPYAKNTYYDLEKPLASGSGSRGAPSSTNYAPPTPWDAPRPYKMARLDHGDESSSTSLSTASAFPTFTNLPPLPPRKAPERIHVPTPSSGKGTRPVASQPPPETFSVGQSFEVAPGVFSFNKPSTTPGVGQSLSTASFNKPPAGPGGGQSTSPGPSIIGFKSPPTGPKALTAKSPTPPQKQPYKPAYSRDGVPTGPRALDSPYSKPAASTSIPSIKQEYTEVSLRDEAPQTQNTRAAETPLTPVETTSEKPSRFQPAARPADQQDNPADKQKGANLVQEFLSSLQLKPNAGLQGPESSTTQQKDQSSQNSMLKVETREAQLPPFQPQPHSEQVAPPQEERPQRSDWYDGSEIPPFRSPEADVRAGQTKPASLPTVVLLNTLLASTSSLPSIPQVASLNPPVDHASKTQVSSVHPSASLVLSGPPPIPASQLQAVPSSSSSVEKLAKDHADNMKRKRSKPQRNENLLAIQSLLREASDIKREINAKVAREAVVIAQLKALDSSWLPRPVKIGSDPSEDMKDELARLQYELEGERKLREEAENAIRDVRRECKEPFIVPSLLDAFVEVSKLTTRSLRPSQPSQIAATPTEADMSLSPMN